MDDLRIQARRGQADSEACSGDDEAVLVSFQCLDLGGDLLALVEQAGEDGAAQVAKFHAALIPLD